MDRGLMLRLAAVLALTAPLFPAGAGAAPAGSPAAKIVILPVNGKPRPLSLWRFDQPGIPFTTYYPSDLALETPSSDEGQAVRFLLQRRSKTKQEALLHVFLFPAGADEKTARALLQITAGSRGVKRLSPPAGGKRSWAVEAYSLSRKGGDGWIALGKHGNRWFHVLVDYPTAAAGALVPRAEQVLKELRWRDTGRGLAG